MGGQRSTAAWREKHKDVGCSFFPARPVLALQWIVITVSQNNYKPRISKTETRGHFLDESWPASVGSSQGAQGDSSEHLLSWGYRASQKLLWRKTMGGFSWALKLRWQHSGDKGWRWSHRATANQVRLLPTAAESPGADGGSAGQEQRFPAGAGKGWGCREGPDYNNRVPEDSGSARAQ